MKDDKKSSIIKEALIDHAAIVEAAEANAKKKLAEEFPAKYSELIKEELQNKNKSKKESYKKLDNSEESKKDDDELNKEESVMKKDDKETTKVEETAGKDGVFTEKPKEVPKVEEDVKITDTVGDGDPFKEKAKKVEETAGDGKPFNQKTKKLQKVSEEFDITGLNVDGVDSALDSADDDDEIITIDELAGEIDNMQGLGEELSDMGGLPQDDAVGKPVGQSGDAFTQLVNMRNQIDEMLKGMSQEQPVEDMQNADTINNVENQHPENTQIDEDEITDDDVLAVLGDVESDVDEAHGVTYAERRKVTGRHNPAQDYLSQGEVDQSPEYVQESKNKINGLINENKKLTKKLNESIKQKESVTALVEQYKTALGKYRNQLKEMATFNTNLAHVNNLLVNEGLALTQEDKIKIINEFKMVDSIAESKEKYNNFLVEMKESKKTLTESFVDKVSASVAPSSKQKLEEAKEVTAYANDQHIQRMKKLIESIEHRGKK